jgi:hypothetical protein
VEAAVQEEQEKVVLLPVISQEDLYGDYWSRVEHQVFVTLSLPLLFSAFHHGLVPFYEQTSWSV